MDFDKQTREGEPCRGVIKKLFPSKRYGFAVCECAKHTGEAHFNYSDLDMPEHERSCLVVGWRIDFNVIEQHKKTDHCDYRAIQVKPVEVMVVQCEVSEVWENQIAILTCRELTGKIIYVTRNKYNGKFENEAVTRRDTCRAAVTWEQMKSKKTFALHCSQDTVSPTTGSPYRPKFKTPEKRPRRSDGHSFSDSFLTSSSCGYPEDLFLQSVSDPSDLLVPRGGHDSGLVSPEDPSRNFGGNVIRGLGSTSTPKQEKNVSNFDCSKYSASTATSPHVSNGHKGSRANSMSSVGSSGNTSSSHNFGHKSHGNVNSANQNQNKAKLSAEDLQNNNITLIGKETATGCSLGGGSMPMLRSGFSSGDGFKENRYGASRRNLDREFDTFSITYNGSEDLKRLNISPSRNSAYADSTKMMSLLALNDLSRADEKSNISSMSEQGVYSPDGLFGLYDASRGHDEIESYPVRSHTQNYIRSFWDSGPTKSSPPDSGE